MGYGRRPLQALVWLIAIWAIGAAIYSGNEQVGEIRTDVPRFLQSPEWVLCGVPADQSIYLPSVDEVRAGLAAPDMTQIACFLSLPETAALPKFNPWMYSMDALVPGLESGQKYFWSPDVRYTFGKLAKQFEYF